MNMLPTSRLRDWLTQSPVALPTYFDRASEWWWSRPPRIRIVVVCALVVAALSVISFGSRSGDTVTVLVASRDIPAGVVVGHTDVREESRPARYAPATPANTVGQIALVTITRGSVLTEHQVGTPGASVHLEPGRVAVAVHHEAIAPVTLGDRVTFVDANFAGQVLTASAARLFHRDGDVLWFAVDPADAAGVSAATQSGRVGVILHPRTPES